MRRCAITTIAFDGETLAADRMMGNRYNVSKIHKIPGGYAAGAGDFDCIIEVVEWLRAGSNPDQKPDLSNSPESDIIVVSSAGKVSWLTWPFLRAVQLAEKQVAYGSGGGIALGAMAAGATAKQAVAIACRFDKYTGQGIDAVQVVKKKK